MSHNVRSIRKLVILKGQEDKLLSQLAPIQRKIKELQEKIGEGEFNFEKGTVTIKKVQQERVMWGVLARFAIPKNKFDRLIKNFQYKVNYYMTNIDWR